MLNIFVGLWIANPPSGINLNVKELRIQIGKCICNEEEIILMQKAIFPTNDNFPIERQYSEVGSDIAFHE
jgi:hypothetical protein